MATAATLLSAAVRPFRHFGRLQDFAATLGTELVILGCSFLSLRLAAVYWGPDGFGEYVLFRRSIALFTLPLSLSVTLGITRYVAIARSVGRSERAYAVSALLLVLATLSLSALVVMVAATPLARLLFGARTYAPLVRALMLAVAGLVLHGVGYGIFRGRLDMRSANILQFTNIALVPLLVFLQRGLTVVAVATLIGGTWTLVAAAALWTGLRSGTGAVSGPELRHATRDLLSYGLPRVPGEFALSALFSFPVSAIAHLGGVAQAGFLGFSISLLTMIASAFTPLGLIMLPSVAALIARGEVAELRRNTFRVTLLCLAGTALGVGLLELVTPVIVVYGLGSEFAAAIPVVRLVLLASVPYVSYVVLRNVLDAAHTRPFNTKNLLVGLVIFALLSRALGSADDVPVAFVIAVTCVGITTAIDSWRMLGALHADTDT
jgi:O-antigen/teichoic acid export membrane protein